MLLFSSKRVKVRHHSYENEFDLHENETACGTHYHMRGFALRLVVKRRHKRTRKWPILGTFLCRPLYDNRKLKYDGKGNGNLTKR